MNTLRKRKATVFTSKNKSSGLLYDKVEGYQVYSIFTDGNKIFTNALLKKGLNQTFNGVTHFIYIKKYDIYLRGTGNGGLVTWFSNRTNEVSFPEIYPYEHQMLNERIGTDFITVNQTNSIFGITLGTKRFKKIHIFSILGPNCFESLYSLCCDINDSYMYIKLLDNKKIITVTKKGVLKYYDEKAKFIDDINISLSNLMFSSSLVVDDGRLILMSSKGNKPNQAYFIVADNNTIKIHSIINLKQELTNTNMRVTDIRRFGESDLFVALQSNYSFFILAWDNNSVYMDKRLNDAEYREFLLKLQSLKISKASRWRLDRNKYLLKIFLGNGIDRFIESLRKFFSFEKR